VNEQANAIISWMTSHLPGLVLGAIVIFVLYRLAKPAIHRVVLRLLQAQQSTTDGGSAPPEELSKRAATLEDLLGKVVRAIVFIAVVALVLSVFELWPLLAGLGLIAAALTLAGQDIVLDYLMGFLILVEGQYYKGDWIAVRGPLGAVEGEVEDIGMRRTTMRDATGTVHSVSNGLIRLSSNLTRVYSVASAEVTVLRPQELDRAIEVARGVATDLASDPEWGAAVLDTPVTIAVIGLSIDGVTFRVARRVKPVGRLRVASELRRRLAYALSEAAIETRRWDLSDSPEAPVEKGRFLRRRSTP
jgi:moderate conductance mechanosensitive channel